MAKQQAETEKTYSRGAVTAEKVFDTIQFPVSPEKMFHLGHLINVIAETVESEKNEPYDCITFTFKEVNGQSIYSHREFAITKPFTDKSGNEHTIEEQCGWQDRVLAQLYNVYMGLNAHVDAKLGDNAESDADFFAKVANSFNTNRNGKPIYQNDKAQPMPVWLKLVYVGNYVKFPSFGNFIDLYVEGKPTNLRSNKGDVFTPPSANKPNVPPTGGAGGAAPSMPPGFSY